MVITVKTASFPAGPPVAWVNHERSWECPGLSAETVLETDPQVVWEETGSGSGGRGFDVTLTGPGAAFATARIETDGPILASTPVEAVRIDTTGIRLLEELPDASRRFEMPVIARPVHASVTIQLSIFAGGVFFEGVAGDPLLKELTAADFDDLGCARVVFILAPGVETSACHELRAFQGEDLIGQR